VLDDLLLDAIGDHCREGLAGLFLRGYVTGALTVGYCAVEAPGAPPTNRGRPRTLPQPDPQAAALVRQHFEWIRDGLPLAEGLRRWRAAGGPCDRRSTIGRMSYGAYRRLLTNVRYTGRWEFGRKRNSWSSKKDYTRQVVMPDAEVKAYHCEELRLVSDELFLAVQQRLRDQETGPRGPRASREVHLWDLVTGLFHCARCRRRFHVCGFRVPAMRCPDLDCPGRAVVNRREAVEALCARLTELIRDDPGLIAGVAAGVQRLAARGGDETAELAEVERKVRVLSNKIDDLIELAGEGSDEERGALKARIRAAQAERAGLQLEVARRRSAQAPRVVTDDEVRAVLAEFGRLLLDGAAGRLGPEAVYKAADLLRRLAGGQVWVDVEARAGRKRGVVRGRITPRLLQTATDALGAPPGAAEDAVVAEAEVWLRRPPRLDAVAAEVRRLYEDEGLGFRAIAKQLNIGCGNVHQSYLRYYELRGQPAPPRRPRGRRRSS
jgi:hypothetical protein